MARRLSRTNNLLHHDRARADLHAAVPGPDGTVPGLMLRVEQTIRFVDDAYDVKDQLVTLADATATRWPAHRNAYTRRIMP